MPTKFLKALSEALQDVAMGNVYDTKVLLAAKAITKDPEYIAAIDKFLIGSDKDCDRMSLQTMVCDLATPGYSTNGVAMVFARINRIGFLNS